MRTTPHRTTSRNGEGAASECRKYTCNANQHPEISVAEKLHFQRETDAAAYRAELVKYSPEQLSKLVQCERAKENAELIARIQSEENARFFNLPNAKADFGHYCKAAVWALDEAIALSFGKEPRIVNWKSVSPWVHVSAFARNYERRRDLCVRALRVGQLFDPVYPSVFLAWAKDKKIDLSTELSSAAVDHSISFQGWKDLYENLDGRYKSETNTLMQKYRTDTSELVENYKRDVGALTEQLLAARSELAKLQVAGDVEIQASPPLVEDRPLKTRERESLQLNAVICAIPAFSFDPDKRNDASRRSTMRNLVIMYPNV